ncbi:MAG: hypothetical protein EOP59_12510 [Sphingomonadales bacterium]|nr:MAG: hypothetical protein EOP59_12510 [Sphingomonadales bacterium]
MKLAPLALAGALLAGSMVLPSLPAAAQNQRIIDVFGNDPCPRSNGEEIVVCNRHPDRERYRIPPTLRRTEEPRGQSSGVALAESTDAASRTQTGIDTCSAVGAGGQTGCIRRDLEAARAARKQAAQQAPVIDGSSGGN